MKRTLAVGLGALGAAIVLIVAGGAALLEVSYDPAALAQRECSSGHMGPVVSGVAPGGCRNFKITARNRDGVDFTFDRSDGSHCYGYYGVARRGWFDLPMMSDLQVRCGGS